MSPVRVEIWSDVVCPWCFIGKRRFDTAITELRNRGVVDHIEVIYKSFQLDPTAPVGKPMPVRDAYAKKFGGLARAQQILDHVTKTAAQDGIAFNMDIAVRANTVLAHRAMHWVLETHGALAQASMKEMLLAAYFTDGKDIGDTEVVLACATACGYDSSILRTWLGNGGGETNVARDIEGAHAREITAVPSFVIDDRFIIPGAQDVEVFIRALQKALAT